MTSCFRAGVRDIVIVSVCMMLSTSTWLAINVNAQARIPGEIVQFIGDTQPSEEDLAKFFAHTELAFLGTIESVTPVFLQAPDGTDTVFTRMAFRPTAFIKGRPRPPFSGTIEVWERGGSYLETPAGRQPFRPATILQRLQRGAEYFVAVATIDGYPSLANRYILSGGTDTLVQIASGQATVLEGAYTEWVTSVTSKGRVTTSTPGRMRDDATAFQTAIGNAVRKAR